MGSGTEVTATDKARLTTSGFLSHYARLAPVAGLDGIQCWRDSELNVGKFEQVLISRIAVSLKPAKGGAPSTIDPSDIKVLTDYFHDTLVRFLRPQMQVVDNVGSGVIVIRIALTDLVPTTTSDSLAGTLVLYAFIAEASSGIATGRPAGSSPYMGEAGMEMQVRDGSSGMILAECRDTEIGRKCANDIHAGAVGAAQI